MANHDESLFTLLHAQLALRHTAGLLRIAEASVTPALIDFTLYGKSRDIGDGKRRTPLSLVLVNARRRASLQPVEVSSSINLAERYLLQTLPSLDQGQQANIHVAITSILALAGEFSNHKEQL